MPRLIGFTFFILSFSFLNAQEFGGNPSSIKWNQISTDTVRVIFPVGMDSAAQRVSSIVHFLSAKNNSLGTKVKKINIVLQNQSTVANAYVGLGPIS
jgi:ABC-type sulfate transport system substrate-binding protein